MELHDIKEVVEMNGTEAVNEFLKAGWVLLNTVIGVKAIPAGSRTAFAGATTTL